MCTSHICAHHHYVRFSAASRTQLSMNQIRHLNLANVSRSNRASKLHCRPRGTPVIILLAFVDFCIIARDFGFPFSFLYIYMRMHLRCDLLVDFNFSYVRLYGWNIFFIVLVFAENSAWFLVRDFLHDFFSRESRKMCFWNIEISFFPAAINFHQNRFPFEINGR